MSYTTSLPFTPLAKGKLLISDATQATIDEYLARERQHAKDEVVAFLVANDLDHHRWPLRLEEGGAVEVITRVVSEMRADLLIMGTHGRAGLLKALIGSATEIVLRSLSVDILAVPPARR